MDDYARVRAVKIAVENRLLMIPGVHAVGLGPKYVKGQSTRQPAIIIFLVKKKSIADISAHELIPSEIDGAPTDIFQAPRPKDASILEHYGAAYRHMVGGVQISAGSNFYAPFLDSDPQAFGTLGCFARTKDTPPKIVALTCDHVVRPMVRSSLDPNALGASTAKDAPNISRVIFDGANVPGCEVIVEIRIELGGGQFDKFSCFYTTGAGDTADTVAQKFATLISAATPKVTASANGRTVQIKWTGGSTGAITGADVLSPRGRDPGAKLTASITGTTITFAGQVAGDNYGVYVNINLGGVDQPTRGAFAALQKNMTPEAVAKAVAKAITDTIPASVGLIANPTGAAVTVIGGAQYIVCDISSDTRIGQPDRCYCSACSWCCGQLLGRVYANQLHLDAALVQLKAGQTYKAEIVGDGMGVVNGFYDVTLADISAGFKVRKRGIATGVTSGVIHAAEMKGTSGGPRFYVGAMSILWAADPSNPNDKGPNFGDEGDSGSVVVRPLKNSAGNPACDVVGLLFALGKDDSGATMNVMTPIKDILDTFQIELETATAPNDVRTVSEAAGVSARVMAPLTALGNDAPLSAEARGALSGFERRVVDARDEIAQTPVGRDCFDAVRRHLVEGQILFRANRRVATVWRRSGGPQMARALTRVIEAHDRKVPHEIDGRPVLAQLKRIQLILNRYGSPAFVADLNRLAPHAEGLIGLTYPQILASLGAKEG